MSFWFSFFLLICASFFTWDKEFGTLQKQLSKIPYADQKKLEILFERMMTGDYFAATLFGKKPLTFQEFHDDPWKLSSYVMMNPYNHFYLDEGWQTWLKYKQLFPSSRFIFTKITSNRGGYEFLILINKAAFREMFDSNYDLFEKVLGPTITVDAIFQQFEDRQKAFYQILNEHEGLVGLVLGYGREGSMQVYRDWSLKLKILKHTLFPLFPPMKEENLPNAVAASIKFQEKKLAHRGTKWHEIRYEDASTVDPYGELKKKCEVCEFLLPPWQERISLILAPNFTVVKGSEEAKHLKKENELALKRARNIFREKSFLTGFLEEYCKDE